MKKLILLSIAIFMGMVSYSQNYMLVNSEKIFKSIPKYTETLATIDALSGQYQQKIDVAYQEIEKSYNNYQLQKQQLSEASRQAKEDAIIAREKEVKKYQQDIFGPEGEMMKKRVEIMKPIQDKVFGAIEKYAKSGNYDMVIDLVSNSSIIYSTPRIDKTDEIIKLIATIKF